MMNLPDEVIIPRDKLTRYLLVFQPESDKSQFLAQAGFTQENPDALEAAIREMVRVYPAELDREDRYGRFYRIEGSLKGANERDLLVVTVWIVRTNEEGIYRFVTLKRWRKS